jgi:hypothetical protein
MHIAVSHRLLPFPPDQLHLMILLLLLLRTFRPRCKSIFSFLSSMMSNSSLLPCFWACHVHGKHFKAPPFPSSKYCLCSLGTLLLREPITHPHRLRLPPSPAFGYASGASSGSASAACAVGAAGMDGRGMEGSRGVGTWKL